MTPYASGPESAPTAVATDWGRDRPPRRRDRNGMLGQQRSHGPDSESQAHDAEDRIEHEEPTRHLD